jgi:hypothetical protein
MKNWFIVLLFILIAGSLYFTVKAKKAETSSEGFGSKKSKGKFPLKQGSQGKEVLALQKFMNGEVPIVLNFLKIDEDGIFGSKTQSLLFSLFKINEVSEEFYSENNIKNFE